MGCLVIGIWCNGNTTDSGPVIPGSNPGIPTEERELIFFDSLFCFLIYKITDYMFFVNILLL